MLEEVAKAGPTVDLSVYALSIHADYQCQRSGVCCTSDWDVPVELPLYRSLHDALEGHTLTPAARPHEEEAVFQTGADMPDGAAAMVARTTGGDCVFYHRGSGLCVIHRDMGEQHLPLTCRYFPRLAVRDARGTFITLTHYCPTAAAMLFRDDCAIDIVEAPPAFPPGDYEGLIIRPDDWPPLLHPRMLMGHEGYSAWERHMVARCAAPGVAPETVLATLARDARVLRRHRAINGPIAQAVSALPADVVKADAPRDLSESLVRFSEVIGAVPDDMKPPPDEHELSEAYAALVRPEWLRWRDPLNRYLAAKAFASWTAYQGRGVLTIVRGLDAALAVVRVEAARACRNAGETMNRDSLFEAFRSADFVLNHLAAGDELADAWSRVETDRTA